MPALRTPTSQGETKIAMVYEDFTMLTVQGGVLFAMAESSCLNLEFPDGSLEHLEGSSAIDFSESGKIPLAHRTGANQLFFPHPCPQKAVFPNGRQVLQEGCYIPHDRRRALILLQAGR